jgi:hypothetical protein
VVPTGRAGLADRGGATGARGGEGNRRRQVDPTGQREMGKPGARLEWAERPRERGLWASFAFSFILKFLIPFLFYFLY